MPVSTSVKNFNSTMPRMPTITGTQGSFIAVIKQMCIQDPNPQNVISATVNADGTIDIVFAAGTTFPYYTVVLLEGATDSAYNIEYRVIKSLSNGVQVEAPAGKPAGAVAGTMKCRYASGGWQMVKEAPNRLVIRSTASGDNYRYYYEFNDTNAYTVGICAWREFSDFGTGTKRDPVSAINYHWWPKSDSASTVVRVWDIVLNNRTIFYRVNYRDNNSYPASAVIHGLGAAVPMSPSDNRASFLQGESQNMAYAYDGYPFDRSIGVVQARDDTRVSFHEHSSGLRSDMNASWICFGTTAYNSASYNGVNAQVSGYNHTTSLRVFDVFTRKMWLKKLYLGENYSMRAYLPGVAFICGDAAAQLTHRAMLDGEDGFQNRKVMLWGFGTTQYFMDGMLALDLTGPWD